MKLNVLLEVEDSELEPLAKAAKTAKLSVDQFVLYAVREKLNAGVDPATENEIFDYVGQALDEAQALRPGEQFTVGELCGHLDWWSSINPGDRKKLGKIFKRRFIEEKIGALLGKRPDNHLIYARTKDV